MIVLIEILIVDLSVVVILCSAQFDGGIRAFL